MPKAPGKTLSLRPADPFDLIRWLARSQSDPRKAVAELVQNSIDAGAKHATVERRRLQGRPALVIRDDGEGVLPALGREDALRFIASNIGASQKRNVSAEERRRLVISGQYGVGLLGFWSIGRRMEIRSRVGGSGLHVLKLAEDSAKAVLDELPVDLGAAPTFTEIVISELHHTASRALTGRRLADYLAAELRGPILASGVTVELKDALARGLAQKRFAVVPRPFTGEPLRVPPEVAVPGYPSVRLELYLARGAERPAIQVSCAGTLVADDLGELEALDLARPPWIGHELSGVVEFPGFTVPPGSRRGVVPNEAAEAFAAALGSVAPAVEAELERLDRERRSAADRQVVQDLRKALRGLRTRMPQYDLPTTEGGRGEPPEAAAGRGAPELEVLDDEAGGAEVAPMAQPELFAPGPLARVVRPGATARLTVVARQEALEARAEATLEAVEPRSDEAGLGIPEPRLVDAHGETWRSRFDGQTWEVNRMHEDYVALRGEARARLRYLVVLLAKDLAQHAHRVPGAVEASEDVAAILALAERNLRGA